MAKFNNCRFSSCLYIYYIYIIWYEWLISLCYVVGNCRSFILLAFTAIIDTQCQLVIIYDGDSLSVSYTHNYVFISIELAHR